MSVEDVRLALIARLARLLNEPLPVHALVRLLGEIAHAHFFAQYLFERLGQTPEHLEKLVFRCDRRCCRRRRRLAPSRQRPQLTVGVLCVLALGQKRNAATRFVHFAPPVKAAVSLGAGHVTIRCRRRTLAATRQFKARRVLEAWLALHGPVCILN